MGAVVRAAGGPMQVKDVGAEVGPDVAVRGRLEPPRGKTKLADRGWLRKLADGRFTARNGHPRGGCNVRAPGGS
ncbi:hypothetical protein GCM10022403_079840 [Streptomyces coacervatus]|uniref:Uncharacterized protein n=1 Tax=Streptomyces coacervatus TaxID=647381 RepID=A0ABP7J612_9ACTN|nr:hypothetical protein [Streptomyces coacervatus]MDF2269368.1 hypothetical protein [Streptomyces coacervatus]